MIQLRDYQQTAVNEIRTALSQYRRVLFQLPTGGGKCLGVNTPVLMYDGSIKMVQDVVKGDLLMGNDSQPRRVESTCIGIEEMFRITPIKGKPFECNRSHILSLRYSDTKHVNAIRNISVDEYLKLNGHQKHLLKLYRSGVEFEHKDLPIDPYILGLWLAEGTKTAATPNFTINKDDTEIVNYLISLGGKFLTPDKRGHNCYSISLAGITNENGKRKNSCIYRDEFKQCLFSSHKDIGIPFKYKVNSRYNRLQLLAGLLDGDGSTDQMKSGYEITTKYKRLADDILYLSRSLGLAAYCHEKKVDLSKIKDCVSTDIQTYYRITISGFCEEIPLKLVRKRSLPRRMNKNVLNVGFSIESIGVGIYYGFEISGTNRLFLLGDFTVTHNTVCFSYIAQQSGKYGRKVLILSNRIEILKQNGGSLCNFGLDVQYIDRNHAQIPTSRIAVGMSQTLKRRIEKPEWQEYVNNIDLCIVDEAHCCDHDFVYHFLKDSCFVLLVTATPQRQGKQAQLGHFARAMVTGVPVKELVQLGYLTPARHFTIAAPKLDDVEIDNNSQEYNQKSLAKKFEDNRVYYGVIDEWFRICPDRKTLMFCVSSTQAIECTKIFVERGIKARYVLSGNFDDDAAYSGERSEIMDAFANNEFQVLVNVGVCTAGTDIVDIDCIIANYATTSMTKWRQSIGRGSRICNGKKDFIILDAGDNIRRLGFFEQEIEWSLWHDESAGGGIQQMKECPTDKIDINHNKGCGQRVPASCKVCPACGFKFPTDKDEVVLHLEEVSEKEVQDVVSWAAKKKLEGWKLSRIMVQVCSANVGEERKAFIEVYCKLYNKTESEAKKYWFVFKKNVWDKIKHKKVAE